MATDSVTLKLHGSQIATARHALAFYHDVLDKISKKEMDAGVSATDTLAKMAEIIEIGRTLEPQSDLFLPTPPPESWDTPPASPPKSGDGE